MFTNNVTKPSFFQTCVVSASLAKCRCLQFILHWYFYDWELSSSWEEKNFNLHTDCVRPIHSVELQLKKHFKESLVENVAMQQINTTLHNIHYWFFEHLMLMTVASCIYCNIHVIFAVARFYEIDLGTYIYFLYFTALSWFHQIKQLSRKITKWTFKSKQVKISMNHNGLYSSYIAQKNIRYW